MTTIRGLLSLGLLVTTLSIAMPQSASAQASTDEVARRLVGSGIEAARARDWVTARENFRKAYEIQPLPLTLYNLAAAQEKTGQFVEADRSYRIFLRETQPGQNDDFRAAAIKSRDKLQGKICYVVVTVKNLHDQDTLRVGSREIAHAVLGESIPSNPGTIYVSVDRDGQTIARQQYTLAAGSTRQLQLSVAKKAPPPIVSAQPNPANGGVQVGGNTNTGATSPGAVEEEGGNGALLWTAVGVVGVVAVGAAVGATLAFTPGPNYESTKETVNLAAR